jgi:hypothetical protein
MLYTTRIRNLLTARPQLARVWFKTGHARMPLKSVWMNEAKLRGLAENCYIPSDDKESCEPAVDEHLVLAA